MLVGMLRTKVLQGNVLNGFGYKIDSSIMIWN